MTLPAVVQQNLLFLRQGRDLLELVDDDVYTTPAENRPRAAGIGPHLRHCLDFYDCFLRDLDTGRIDYDRRHRQSPIETDRSAALKMIERVAQGLQRLDSEQIDREIQVRHDPTPAESPTHCWHPSTVGRELRFLVSHTVHHYALIALILRTHDVEPGEEFGIAPATLAHWSADSGLSSKA